MNEICEQIREVLSQKAKRAKGREKKAFLEASEATDKTLLKKLKFEVTSEVTVNSRKIKVAITRKGDLVKIREEALAEVKKIIPKKKSKKDENTAMDGLIVKDAKTTVFALIEGLEIFLPPSLIPKIDS